jgi:hypothetical protein
VAAFDFLVKSASHANLRSWPERAAAAMLYCTVLDRNIRVFAQAVVCLARVGKEISMEVRHDQVGASRH